MDKNAIKKYAVWARRELISRVSQKALQYGITDKDIVPATATSVNGVILSAEEVKQRKALIERINAKGYEQVMEEVAYTWFNRFIALRFMEVNGYLPSRVRVFTDENNAFNPQILTEAISLEMDGLDMEKVYTLKDANDDDGLFKYLVIVQCNALSPILPKMFQRISDYTELLFPDNLLREGSAIEQMISMIPEEDWKDAVQIIGWLYQYYNSEKKDEVFAALKKNVKITKENIPAATQLFTPDWIVRYMVENSLGRLWVEGHPNDELRAGWKYYLDEAEQEPTVQTQLAAIRKEYATITPEQIKCIDPCAGSGHILAYMFDVLVQIYEVYGYTAREAVRSIVVNNIYGLDIDDRAAQLAYFAVIMKARQYDRRYLTRKDEDGNPDVPQPHVYAIVESNGIDAYALDYFVNGDPKLKAAMSSIIKEMRDAKEYGSILRITPVDYSALYARFNEICDDISMSREAVLNDLLPLVKTAEVMTRKYDIVVTNPPYRGISDVEPKLQDFVKENYPDSYSDLSTVFMERCLSMSKKQGYVAMINIPVWMSLASYKELREKLLVNASMVNMLHLGRGMFGSDYGTTAFVIANRDLIEYTAVYKKFFKKQVSVESEDTKRKLFFGGTKDYHTKQGLFMHLPNKIVAYWATQSFVNAFMVGKNINDCATVFEGLKTRDKDRFLRMWYEVANPKWKPYAKGGAFRRWYGNNDYVVNWGDNGDEVRNFKKSSGANFAHYFEPSITYTAMTMSKFTGRYIDNQIFGGGGGGITTVPNNVFYLLGFVNSVVYDYIISAMKSTVNFEVGQIGRIPVLFGDADKTERIKNIAEDNVGISRQEWDEYEYSWDFKTHPLVRISRELWDATAVGAAMQYYYGGHPKVSCPLELCFMLWQGECNERFKKLKSNEEELNKLFIDIYGLQDELSPEVDEQEVTVRKADLQREIKSLISYAVGCMLGRYSLDVPGLAYAGGEWDDSKYVTFKADKDSIIPICDDEYFADDIVGRFIRFIEVVYGKDTLQENLRFIADALGGSGQPKDVIRKYFMDEFYADHLKIYQKRPIYWLFDSGKKGGFRALVYMHRYQPDTIARMRTDYVHEQQARYRTAIADLEQRIASASTSERVKLSKRLKTLQEQATEIQGYEEKIHHLADQYIAIDLDDGVKKNYEIFKDVLAKIK